MTLVGNLAPQVELPLQAVVTRELTLAGSCASSGEYPACLDLMARGAVNVDPLLSAAAPLAEGPGLVPPPAGRSRAAEGDSGTVTDMVRLR